MAKFVSAPDTFVVEEIPAYLPAGTGTHTYVWIEKRDLTTVEAIRRLARATRVNGRDIGYAGLKDRHATTRQWLSLPDVDPQNVMALGDMDGLRVLQAARHGNKLRLGHLKGNRFEVLLLDVQPGESEALQTRFAALVRDGVPNRFGTQRFGAQGDNVARALALVRGEREERDGRMRRLLLSSLQSAVFNDALVRRQDSGGLLRVRPGDVLQKTASGGLFVTSDPRVDQPRVDAGEVVPTGPMPGNREVEPPEGSEARSLEDAALAAVGVTRTELAAFGRDLPGARRPVVVRITPGEPPAEATDGGLRLRFSLPAGAYATVVIAALDVAMPSPAARGPAAADSDADPGPA